MSNSFIKKVKFQESYLILLYRTVIITENVVLPNSHFLLSELEMFYCSSVYLEVNKIRPCIKYKQKGTQT